MNTRIRQAAAALASLACFALNSGAAQAASMVKLTDVHICCKGCATAIEKAVAKTPDVKPSINQKEGTVELTAQDDAALQKAVNRIAAAGFHGGIAEDSKVQFKAVKVPEGNVQRLEIAHIHNCCAECTKAIKAAIAEVEGVAGDSLKAKSTKFVIEGDFSAEEAIKAIEKAGFHASLPKEKVEKKAPK